MQWKFFLIHLILILNFSEVILQLLYCYQFHKLIMHLVKYKHLSILIQLPFNII